MVDMATDMAVTAKDMAVTDTAIITIVLLAVLTLTQILRALELTNSDTTWLLNHTTIVAENGSVRPIK